MDTVSSASTRPGLLWPSAAAIVTAVIAVSVVHVMATAANDPLLVAPELGGGGAKPLALGLTALATFIGGLIGVGLAALTRRFFARPGATFLGACVVGLVAYGALAFVRSDHASTAVWLNVMHLAAAMPIVGVLTLVLNRDPSGAPHT